jgi:hypothetical protein
MPSNRLKTHIRRAAASAMLEHGHFASALCQRPHRSRMGVARAALAARVAPRSSSSPLAAHHPHCHLLCVAHRRGQALSAAGMAAVADGLSLLEKVAAGCGLDAGWMRAGCGLDATWERLHTAPRERLRVRLGRDPQPSAGSSARHSVETTGVGGLRGDDGGKQVKGRTRHLLVDTEGLVLRAVVHPADIRARDGVQRVLHGGMRNAHPVSAPAAWLARCRLQRPGEGQGPDRAAARLDGADRAASTALQEGLGSQRHPT